ncbi:MAG: ectonucleotide pyrophosphatase/phosphodiesterase [Rudaea sp.]
MKTKRLLPLRIATLLLALLLAACQTPSRKPVESLAYAPLILISLDGFRADYIDRGITPNLARLAREGVHAKSMRSAFPTLTFPNHYTLVTGLYPDHHGMVHNTMHDDKLNWFSLSNKEAGRDRRWWDGGEPLWVTADKQGLRTATMFWPGSEADTHGYRPDYYLPFDGKVTGAQRVDQVLAWLDLPAAQRPQFITLYFDRIDHEGHDFGPDSPEVAGALRATDAAVGYLVEQLARRKLLESANLVIVSDHGMTPVNPSQVVVLDAFVDVRDIDLVTATVIATLNPQPGREAGVEKALLGKHDHFGCWRKGELPARLHYGSNPRIPAIVCIADDGWIIETQARMDRPNRHVMGGEHGYDNADPNMRALFIAHGPAFRHGLVVPEFDNVNVYALLARVLGITPAPNDGDIKVTQGMLNH